MSSGTLAQRAKGDVWSLPLMDEATLLSALGGNRALLRELARLCLEVDAPRLRAQLHTAVAARDVAAIESAAHALKGLVAEFRAEAARTAAAEIEKAARHGRLEDLAAPVAAFEREWSALEKLLTSVLTPER
jgi:HPt (histidine-containing phosphotransfer) domain-containing protein